MDFEKQYGAEHKWHSLPCPHCKKLFRVNRSDLFPIDSYSFSCLSCQQPFWAALDENYKVSVWGQKPLASRQDNTNQDLILKDEKTCSHCYYTSKVGMADCYQCGFSFSDVSWMEKLPYASYSLRKSYEYLLKNFNKTPEHERFVKQCLRENNIPFGVKCYGHFLKIHPDNVYSRKMIKYFEAISFAQAQPQTSKKRGFIEEKLWSYKTGWIHALLFYFAISCVAMFFIARYILTFY